MRKKFTALSVSAAVLLAASACGGDGQGDVSALSGVDLQVNEENSPEVILNTPVETDEPSSRILSQGDGDQVEGDSIVWLSIAFVDPGTGAIHQENFSGEPETEFIPAEQPEPQSEQEELFYEQNQLVVETLTDARVGSEIAIYLPAVDELGTQENFMVLRVEDHASGYAQGEVQEQSGDLPEVTGDNDEEPEISAPEGEAPEDLESEVLIQGEGEEVEPGDEVWVNYKGITWDEGEVFDSSWENGVPIDFPLDGVIEGWTEGLPGHTVGSRVLMVIPADQAYGPTELEDGSENESPLAGETLVFVVDILAANEAPEPEPMPEMPEGGAPQMPESLDDIPEEDLEQFSEEELAELEEQLEQMNSGAEGSEEGEDDSAEDSDEESGE